MSALNEKWIELGEGFKHRLNRWQIIYDGLPSEQKRKIDTVVSNVLPNLEDKWLSEQIESRVLRLIYARYIDIDNIDVMLQELVGSRYQTYFMRDRGLFDML